MNHSTLNNNRPVIAVFGSSAPKEGQPDYAQAYEVGRLLAEAGYAVATGGYSGTMTAVSRGAADAGGYVIGVTSSQIEQFRDLPPNDWITKEYRYPTLQERLSHLVTQNEGMIVLPGGIGTLAELALAWNLIQVNEIPKRPLILLGKLWLDTLAAFIQEPYIMETHRDIVINVLTPEEAVGAITKNNELRIMNCG